MTPKTRSIVAALLAGVIATTSCKDNRSEFAQRSQREIPAHLRVASEGLTRMIASFVPVIEQLAPSMVESIVGANEERVRFQLIDLRTRQAPGGSMTMFPVRFIVAVGSNGNAIARDIAQPDDLMRGMPLATMFASVRVALDGTAGVGVGELPATSDQPTRVVMVAAAPVRNPAGQVVGALAAGIGFGDLARSLRQSIQVQVGTRPVLWVGLVRNGRVLPSGRDRDVPQIFLVPQPLLAQVPRDANARLAAGNGSFTWNFIENNVRPWGAGMTRLAQFEGTNLLVFRTEPEAR